MDEAATKQMNFRLLARRVRTRTSDLVIVPGSEERPHWFISALMQMRRPMMLSELPNYSLMRIWTCSGQKYKLR